MNKTSKPNKPVKKIINNKKHRSDFYCKYCGRDFTSLKYLNSHYCENRPV